MQVGSFGPLPLESDVDLCFVKVTVVGFFYETLRKMKRDFDLSPILKQYERFWV